MSFLINKTLSTPPKTDSFRDSHWTLEILPRNGLLEFPLKEVWRYRDLLLLLVYRDFVSLYKQTILGPLWFLIQPILTTVVFTLVFGRIAGLSTDGIPPVLFYLSGITCWAYFSDCLTKTSETFTQNASIFGKVYFPRIIMPLSVVVSSLLKFGVQFLLFLGFLIWASITGSSVQINRVCLLLPLLILLMGVFSLGLGMIISSLTTKYRDLRFLLQFAVQLLMYGTPVIYPASALPEKYRLLILANPMTPIIETFRYGFLGAGEFTPYQLLYCLTATLVTFLIGLVIFNRVEKTFLDTV